MYVAGVLPDRILQQKTKIQRQLPGPSKSKPKKQDIGSLSSIVIHFAGPVKKNGPQKEEPGAEGPR
jgi:hypothetical protein